MARKKQQRTAFGAASQPCYDEGERNEDEMGCNHDGDEEKESKRARYLVLEKEETSAEEGECDVDSEDGNCVGEGNDEENSEGVENEGTCCGVDNDECLIDVDGCKSGGVEETMKRNKLPFAWLKSTFPQRENGMLVENWMEKRSEGARSESFLQLEYEECDKKEARRQLEEGRKANVFDSLTYQFQKEDLESVHESSK